MEEPVRMSNTKGLSGSATIPTPRKRMGFRDDFPTMVGAFSRFSVSATMSVCCRSTGKGGGQEKVPPSQGSLPTPLWFLG